MTDIVTETLEDGTEYSFDIDLCYDIAEDTISDLYELEGNEPNFDFSCCVFGLFHESAEILKNSGWTTEELIDHLRENDVTT